MKFFRNYLNFKDQDQNASTTSSNQIHSDEIATGNKNALEIEREHLLFQGYHKALC